MRQAKIRTVQALLFATLFSFCHCVSAQTFTVVYDFEKDQDGEFPSGLAVDPAGNLYGTAEFGGRETSDCPGGCGLIFKIDSSGNKTTVYKLPGGDLKHPIGGIGLDHAGNLYGTTYGSDCCDYGAVFKVDLNSSRLLTSHFHGYDGQYPTTALVQDAGGKNLYGVTTDSTNSLGVVFMVDSYGMKAVLSMFMPSGDLRFPTGSVALDSGGNIYGTTLYGGYSDYGTVFKLDSGGVTTVLYRFPGVLGGANPWGPLLWDNKGNFYGITQNGGTVFGGGGGTIFKLKPDGQVTYLHRFNGLDNAGSRPNNVLIDSDGNLYGTTVWGGAHGFGTIFELKRDGTFLVLYNFREHDGQTPTSLVIDRFGSLYGTIGTGGKWGAGRVFKLTLP